MVATGLEISASAPMWMVGDELVGVSESAVLHISGTTGAIATKFVNNVEAISGDAALAFHPALGSLFSAGGVKHPVEEQQFQPGGVRLPYVCPQ